MNEQVCTVLVTYNRKTVLLEALQAILTQTYPVDKILIVDNASTDGTPQLLQTAGYLDHHKVEYLRLPTNRGGAGGFQEGLKRGFAEKFEWLWLMDDDSIPQPEALARLFAARERFEPVQQPRLLASKVVWLDGTLHPMNIPKLKIFNSEDLFLAAQQGTLSIRHTTFVSVLLHRSLIEQYGLPIADYFIWADDVEYTARILRYELGVVVPDSLVCHKTVKKYTRMDDAGPRYYYHVRNNIWMVTRSQAFSKKERVKLALNLIREIPVYLVRSRLSRQSLLAVILGVWDGLLLKPKP